MPPYFRPGPRTTTRLLRLARRHARAVPVTSPLGPARQRVGSARVTCTGMVGPPGACGPFLLKPPAGPTVPSIAPLRLGHAGTQPEALSLRFFGSTATTTGPGRAAGTQAYARAGPARAADPSLSNSNWPHHASLSKRDDHDSVSVTRPSAGSGTHARSLRPGPGPAN